MPRERLNSLQIASDHEFTSLKVHMQYSTQDRLRQAYTELNEKVSVKNRKIPKHNDGSGCVRTACKQSIFIAKNQYTTNTI